MLLLKSGPTLGPRRVIPYSPIKQIEFSFQPIKRRYLDINCCCIQKRLMTPRVLAALMDLFVSTEEDYGLKDMHFAICRSRKHHSLH